MATRLVRCVWWRVARAGNVQRGYITGVGGGPFGSSGNVVNCECRTLHTTLVAAGRRPRRGGVRPSCDAQAAEQQSSHAAPRLRRSWRRWAGRDTACARAARTSGEQDRATAGRRACKHPGRTARRAAGALTMCAPLSPCMTRRPHRAAVPVRVASPPVAQGLPGRPQRFPARTVPIPHQSRTALRRSGPTAPPSFHPPSAWLLLCPCVSRS